jgi:hypothetical protein
MDASRACLEGFVASLENKCPREHVMPFVFAMVHVQKRAGLRQGLQFKCRERSYCIFPSVFVEKANRLSPASPQQLCRSSPPLWTRALFELCIRRRKSSLGGATTLSLVPLRMKRDATVGYRVVTHVEINDQICQQSTQQTDHPPPLMRELGP